MDWKNIQTKIQSHTILFFKNVEKKKIAIGSGVLLKIDNEHFLISASHVFSEGLKNLYIILHDKELTPGGQLIYSKVPNNREDDNLDFGILKLNEQSTKELKTRFEFLDEKRININHLNNFSNLGYLYYVFGYPSSKTKKHWVTKGLRSYPFVYSSKTKPLKFYHENNWDDRSHLLLSYDMKRIVETSTGNQKKSPNLEGISGCGVWDFDKKETEMEYSLIGIVIETNQNPMQKILIVPKIDIITETIRKSFNLKFRKSKLVNIKLTE